MERYAQINGIKLVYHDSGEGAVLVFLHGLGETHDSWRHQIAFFSKSFRVITPELRGHGQSDDGDVSITLALMTDDTVALLNSLDIKQAHFCGLSMGALLCQELAVRYPQVIKSMTLADGAGFYPEEMATVGLEARLQRIKNMPMKELGALIAEAASKPNADPIELEKSRQMFGSNRKVPYAQATVSTLTADYRPYHAAMSNIPTFILVGQLDPVTPIAFSQYLNEHIVGSKMQILPNASHLSKIDNPTAFNQALLEFLTPYEVEASRRLL
jgi:3-oxoadipate enol-lactonase